MHEALVPLFIVNPVAGNGRAHGLAPRLSAWLVASGVRARMVETSERGHAEEIAAEAGLDGHDRVVVVGGDGTVQEVVNGLLRDAARDRRPPLLMGIIPSGSGNDLAHTLGIPRDARAALEVALGDGVAAIDLGHATNGAIGPARHFAVAGGVGFDAQVAFSMTGHQRFWQKGQIGYFLSTLVELKRFRNRRLKLSIETPDGARVVERTVLFVAIANSPYYGGGMQIAPAAETADGYLDLCVVGDLSRLEALRQLPGIYQGKHATHPAVEFIRARSVRIEGDDDTLVHLDGEPFGGLPLEVQVLPGVLRVATGRLTAEGS